MGSFSWGSLIAGVVGLVVGAAVLLGVLTWLDQRAEAGAARVAVQHLAADVSRMGEFVASNRFSELQTAFVEANFDLAENCPLQPDMAAIVGSIESESVVMGELRFRPSELFRSPKEITDDLAALPTVALADGQNLFPEDSAGSLRGRAVHFYLRSRDLFELFEDINSRASLVSQIVGVCSLFRQQDELRQIVEVVDADVTVLMKK